MGDHSSKNRLTRRRLLTGGGTVLAGAAAISLVGCGSSSSSGAPSGSGSQTAPSRTAAPKKGGRVKVGSTTDLIPSNAPYQLETTVLISQFSTYDTLFRYNTLALNPEPHLAQSYEFNGDQSEVTVALRPNLTFHSGKALDAQAVVDSFNSLTASATPPNQPSGLAKAYVDSVQAVDASHVKFKLKRAGMLVFDLFNFWLIADAGNIADIQKGGLPNGSGPFKITSATPKQGGTLDRFDGYWNPALLDGIDYKVYPDPASLAIAVESGAIDITKSLTIDDALRFGKQGSYRTLTDKGLNADWAFGMNAGGAVTKDKRVRQALYHLVDRSRVINNVFLGQSTQMNCLWPKGSPAYESRYDTDPLNVAKAKQLLSDAGYANGTPSIEVIIPPINFASDIMQLVQADVKKAGINLTLKTLETPVYTQEFLKHSYPGCYILNFGFNYIHPDSLPVMNYQVRIPNGAGYDSPEYEKLLSDLSSTTTKAQRTPLYKQFNEIWDDAMWVFLICSQTFQWVTKKDVANFSVNDFSVPSMEKVSLS